MICTIYALWFVALAALRNPDQYQDKTLGTLKYKELLTPIVKSGNDNRQYLGLVLNNQMKVLLISDPTVDQAVAALAVAVGTKLDPEEMPGMAHLCEHLLFRGSEAYPGIHAIDTQLSENGGYYNAETEYGSTRYFFNVGYQSLNTSLDMFSHMFIDPLFSEEAVKSEVKSVDSENQALSQDDNERLQAVIKSLITKDHPLSHFEAGNITTLYEKPKQNRLVPHKKVKQFFEEYYSADLMSLVVLGRQPLEELKQFAIPKFSRVINKKSPERPSVPLSFNRKLGLEVSLETKGQELISMVFFLPSLQRSFKEIPKAFILYFFRNTGKGTLADYLMRKAWMTSFYAYMEDKNGDSATLALNIYLSPEGLKNKNTIVQLVLEYIDLVRIKGVSQNRYAEVAKISELKFQFQEASDDSFDIATLADAANKMPQSLILLKDTLKSFEKASLKKFFGHMKKENLIVGVFANLTNTTLQEPIYNVNYNLANIPQFPKPTGIKLQLPSPNKFIPTKFPLFNNTDHLSLLSSTSKATLWLAGTPTPSSKAHIHFVLRSRKRTSPVFRSRLNLLVDIIQYDIASLSYDVKQTGSNIAVTLDQNSILVSIHGFTENIPSILKNILDVLATKITENSFARGKENRILELKAFDSYYPVAQAEQLAKVAISEGLLTPQLELAKVKSISFEKLRNFQNTFLQSAYIEMLTVGNYRKKDAQAALGSTRTTLGSKPAKRRPRLESTAIIPKGNFVTQSQFPDNNQPESAIYFYLDMYAYPDSFARTLTELIVNILSQFSFDQLRTVENLGYDADAKHKGFATRGGIAIHILSHYDPIFLESRIEGLLSQFHHHIDNMAKKTLDNYISAMVTGISDKKRNLPETAKHYWKAIASGYYDFDKGNPHVCISNLQITQPSII
ncbi:metalloprotease [Entomophthora muscae]|uniref:Metalloprotease n=1 Tax=Entomophthora muscae TaxID=34485 RepID=A0ACC2UH43_9FUNG|nr:metalloprotease [Entomophthora muscae]